MWASTLTCSNVTIYRSLKKIDYMEKAPDLSVVAPCFNEGEVLPLFIDRVQTVCVQMGKPYEIVLIDDGSRDSTWSVILSAHQKNNAVRGVRLSRNHGHQLALTAGLHAAKGQRILIIDADLQDPPELFPEMLRMLESGSDVIYGVRRHREGETRFKLFTAFLFYRILSLLADVEIPRDTGDFRLMSRKALNALLTMPEQHRFIRGMVAWLGFRQTPIYYDRQSRKAGTSKYPFLKMWRFAVNAITSFSIKPLRLASFLGAACGGMAILGIVYIIVGYFRGHTVPGWTSLIVTILTLGAMQLLVLGIIGEYLGRLFLESKCRPLFIIDQTTDPVSSCESGGRS